MKFIYILISLTVFTSCIYDGSLTDEQVVMYKNDVIKKGDKKAYTMLLDHYYSIGYSFEALPYSIIMADKKSNVTACKQVFYEVIRINNGNIFSDDYSIEHLSKENKRLAISYLIKAAKLGDSECKKILEVDYAKYKINENTIVTDSLIDNLN